MSCFLNLNVYKDVSLSNTFVYSFNFDYLYLYYYSQILYLSSIKTV